jgi:gliding motility-associated-like protein
MRNFYIFIFLLLPSFIFSQTINDCVDAEVVCNNGNITFNPQGAGIDDFANPNNNSGCLATGEHSSAWYYFEINATAPPNQSLGFTISPTGGAGQDYDFALFGPDVSCSDLGNPIRCSYAGPGCAFCPQTGLGMNTTDQTEGAGGDGFVSDIIVQPGQGYFLLVDNFSNNGSGFDLSWTGDAADDLECNTNPPCGLIASAGNGATGCSGDTGISLNGSAIGASGNETYNWVGTNGSTAYLDDPTSPNPSISFPPNVSGTFDFTLTITDDACIDDDMVTVTINPLPIVTLTPPSAVCDDDDTYTIVSSPLGGVWSSNMPNGIVNPSALGPGTYVVDYTYTDANGCTNMDMTTVVINPNPVVSIDFFNTQLCTNDLPIFLTATPAGGTWSPNVPGGQLIPGNLGVGSWTIGYTYIDANGCEGMDEVDINVFPEPVAVITDPGPICETADPLFLTADPTGGTWGPNAIGGVFIPSNYTPGFYPVTYTYTAVFGCVTTTTINIEVVSAPVADISTPPVLCTSSSPYTLMATPSGGSWGPSTPGGIVDPSILGEGQHTAIYTYFDPTGCLVVASETITVEGPPTVLIDPVPDLCVNGDPTTIAGSPTGGTWSPNAPGGVFNPSIGTGSYNVTYFYTDPVSGCSETAITTVNVINEPTVGITGNNSFCTGTSTTLNADTGFSNYAWSSGENTSTISINMEGTYTVTITDGSGCTATAEQLVVENTLPSPTISGATSICIGTSTTLDAGSGFTDYIWSTGDITSTISANLAGTFTVTVTDGNGCTGVDQVDVNITPNLQPSITGDLSICVGVPTTLDAGSGYTNYEWSTTEVTSTISTNQAGTYTVTVTDASGCTGTDQVAISIAPGLSPTITGSPNFCNNTSTIIDAGTYDSYIWSTGSVDQTLTVTANGTYTVTVSDAAGCTGIDEMIVSEFPIPAPQISGSTSFCTGNSTILDAGTWVDYLWSDTSTGSSITVNTAGTYTVTITDGNGCTNSTSVDVVESTSLSPSIVGNLSYCPNGSTTLDAGFGFATYEWSDGSMDQTLEVMTSGDYTVTVSDASGCTGTNVVSVDESIPPTANIIGQNSFCMGTSTTLDAEGGYINYDWSDGSTNQTLTVNQTGTYTVTVTDTNGCTDETFIDVEELQSLNPMLSSNGAFCEGSSTSISAASGFITYVWSDNSTDESIQVASQGTYTVTVTDANGCTGSESISILQNDNPIVNITGDAEFCPGATTICVATPGFVSYLWSDGSTLETIPVSIPGTYTVTVTDGNGCTGTQETTVDELATPTTTISGEPNFCPGESTILDAGTGFVSYVWSNGSTTQDITADITGTFTVTITDVNGCTGQSEIMVSENIPPTPTIAGTPSFCSGNSTILDATGNYTDYVWSDNSTDPTLTVSQSGTYTVTVTDSNGCTGTQELDITEITSLLPTFSGEQDFCQNESTVITAEVGYSSYLWSEGTTTEEISISAPGTYTLTVTDANGCTGTNTISIIENAPPTPTIAGSTTFCIGFSTTLDAGNYVDYLWSDTSTDPTLEVNTEGIFSVTVTDTNGCTGIASTQITESTQLEPVISGDDSFCSGSSTTLNVGAGFSTYIWSDANNSDSQMIDVSTPGTYSVTVTDASGCTGETSIIIEENIPVNAGTANPTTSLCSVDATIINLQNELTGADPNGTWTETSTIPSTGLAFNPTTASFNTNGQNPGTYTFEYFLAGPGFCPDDFEVVTVEVQQTPIAFIDQPIALDCNNPTTILDATNSIGGADLMFEWSLFGTPIPGANSSTLTIDSEGTYNLIITLPTGCSATTFIEMTEDFETPDVDAGMNQQLTCQDGEATLNGSSSIPGAIYNWEGPGITPTNMNEQNPLVTSAGDYTLVVTNPQNGCESTIALVEVIADINSPVFTLDQVDPLDCNNSSQVLSGPFANNFTYQWFLNGNPISNATNQDFEASQPGSYSLEITNTDNGCNATQSVTVDESTDPPAVEAGTADLLTCDVGIITLNGTGSSTGNVTYEWFDPNGNPIPNSNSLSISVSQQGTYTLLVTDDGNGCTATDNVVVNADTNFPTADAGENTNLDCDFNSIQIGGNSSTGPNFTYNWTTQNGGTITNPTNANPSINQPGTYQIMVTDTNNGCTVTDAIIISETTNLPVQINYELMPISCNGEDDGSLTVLNVDGGTEPYQYSFNGEVFSDINTFPFLSEGDYSLIVSDALGCELETEVNLVAPPPFIIDLGEDITIELGETAQIDATFSQSYDSLWWRPEATLLCDDCPTQVVAPLETTAYMATALNFNGCEDSDDITIYVEKNRNVYIPNVFTPNDDGINDVFIIHGGIDVEKIHVLKIFNRWGEQIFEQNDIQPNDYSVGWDGFFKGEKMNPAVFVYFAEIEFKDGRTIIFKGDVALRK